MWQIKNPVIKTTTLDFQSSGQPSRQVTQLFSAGILLINALELVDWQEEKTQFLICESCGYAHCKSGDWISLRAAGERLLILPAFAAWCKNRDISTEYHPPAYVLKRGIPFLTLADYEALQLLHSAFPAVDKIRQLNLQEAIWAFQLEAPRRMFGNPSEKIVAQKEAVIGASEGDFNEHLQFIEAFAQTNRNNESPVELRMPKAAETIISVYLDTHEFVEWKILAYHEANKYLLLNSEFVIAPEK
ncbi:MAG: hypothetical protein HY231_00450 [Acidobacteria bacterium]|nr:hypothetical protein [Acidobacteriota bacterium]